MKFRAGRCESASRLFRFQVLHDLGILVRMLPFLTFPCGVSAGSRKWTEGRVASLERFTGGDRTLLVRIKGILGQLQGNV